MDSLSRGLARVSLRLAIVVLLSLLVAGACYGVSQTPLGQSMASGRGGPPPGRGAAPGQRGAAPAAAPNAGIISASGDQTNAGTGVAAASSAAAPSVSAPPMTRPPGGGGRPASLARGLPELGMNAGVIAALIVIVGLVQSRLRSRRRSQVARSTA